MLVKLNGNFFQTLCSSNVLLGAQTLVKLTLSRLLSNIKSFFEYLCFPFLIIAANFRLFESAVCILKVGFTSF
jgi:hypothetical protein